MGFNTKADRAADMFGFLFWTAVITLVVWWGSGKIADYQDDGAQAGTAAKSASLDDGGTVEAPSLPEGDLYIVEGVFPFIPQPQHLSIACGAGEIRISFETGEAEFINCNPSDASKHLWTGLKPFFNDCRR